MSRWRQGLLFVLGMSSAALSTAPRWFPWRWEISFAAAVFMAVVVTLLLPRGGKGRSLLVWAMAITALVARVVRPYVPERATDLLDFLVFVGLIWLVWWAFFRGRKA